MGFSKESRLKYIAEDPKRGLTLREVEDFCTAARDDGWLEGIVPIVHAGRDHENGRDIAVGLELRSTREED